jgi:GAF domain-containing protein
MENYTMPKCWGTDHKHGAALWDSHLFPDVYESKNLKLLRAALQKRAHDLEKRERELNCLYGISEIVGQPDISMKEMLDRIIVEEGKYRLAWVGFAEEKDGEKIIRPAAQWGYEERYLKNLNISWDDSTRGSGPSGTAIRTRKICVVQHILTDPGYRVWRDQALRQRYAASVAIPLCIKEACTGVLHIYSAEPGAFDEGEVELLTEFAGDLSYGINVLRTRAERNRSQEAFRESEERYRTLFDNAGDAIFVHDFEGQFLNVNAPGGERLGYSREEFLKMNVKDIHLQKKADQITLSEV